jgi:L-ascorbate metabolism protein UlaG (beta-lactamase superfamily)
MKYREGAESMAWILWMFGALAATLLVFTGLLFLQYRRIRKWLPQPSFTVPALRPRLEEWRDDGVRVCWIGHSTIYMNVYGTSVLTDPVFAERVGIAFGGGLTIGPKRHTAPAVPLENVAGADLILLSHAHMDHMDLPTLWQLANPRTRVVTPRGTGRLLRRMPFREVRELDWWETMVLDNGLQITAVPVKHWGRRYPWNKGYSWNGYRIEHRDARLFFAGDTAYTPDLRVLRETGPIDIAFLPIGAYAPKPLESHHCTPEQAWQMFVDMGAKWMVPIHWDTFVLSGEPVKEPMDRLLAAAAEKADRIVIRTHGGEFFLPRTLVPSSPRTSS